MAPRGASQIGLTASLPICRFVPQKRRQATAFGDSGDRTRAPESPDTTAPLGLAMLASLRAHPYTRFSGGPSEVRLISYLRTFTGFGPEARRFLFMTAVYAVAESLYITDFNLYLQSIGISLPMIGLLVAVSQIAGVVASLPAGMLAERVGTRAVMLIGTAMITVSIVLFLPGGVPMLFIGMTLMAIGSQLMLAVEAAYAAAHTRSNERNEYFSLLSTIMYVATMLSAIIGGAAAPALASWLGMHDESAPYRVLLVGAMLFFGFTLAAILSLPHDKPVQSEPEGRRFGLTIPDPRLFARLFLIALLLPLGASQIIPFLNLFFESRFGLDLTGINLLIGVSSLGAILATLVQPALARRFGRVATLVLVQAVAVLLSLVLGFSPILWTVGIAMVIRTMLMSSVAPLFDAFAMDKVADVGRATMSSAMTLAYSLGITVGPLIYGLLQSQLSPDLAYSVGFVILAGTYSLVAVLFWVWFRADDATQIGLGGDEADAPDGAVA